VPGEDHTSYKEGARKYQVLILDNPQEASQNNSLWLAMKTVQKPV
jgi:hypothetical protein